MPATPTRMAPRKVALVALAIFVPLCALLAWWALASRTVPGDRPVGDLLPPKWSVSAAAFAAAGPALILALLIANRRRLKAVMRPSRGRWIGAIVLALLTPVVNFLGVPIAALLYLFTGWGGLILVLMLLVVWYPVSALIISGARSGHAVLDRDFLRSMVFFLCWCSAYGWMLLVLGVMGERDPLILHLPGIEILLLERF